jgi:hypothetical protein
MNKFVYAIFGKVSGEKRISLYLRREVVNLAALECSLEGTTLEEYADISYAEDADGNFHPTRELEDEELFDVAVDKLNDDGRLFLVFSTDALGTREFIATAAGYGLEKSARLLSKYA